MFIKRSTSRQKGKTYVNHLLVESIATPKGPRHRVICSLGSLKPAPREEWAHLAHKLHSALWGQKELFGDPTVDALVARVKNRQVKEKKEKSSNDDLVSIHTDEVRVEDHRVAGPVHVGHQMWKKLKMDSILQEAGLSQRGQLLTEVMTMNRLVSPSSEHAMPEWIRRTALGDVLGEDFSTVSDEALYRNLDRLHPQRNKVEEALSEQERSVFNLDDSFYLYDLTSTYFEGQCKSNSAAKRGYSRDKRGDCKQVVVGLVLDRDGFPKAHEVFDGNRVDMTTVEEMLTILEQRTGSKQGSTVVVDRGMTYDENLKQIKGKGYHYLVACRPGERNTYFDEIEDDEGWVEIIRKPSPRNEVQKKSRVWVKRSKRGDETHILCRSEGREEKDRGIREKHEQRLLKDLDRLEQRITKGKLKAADKIHEAIGRLKERYPRVARYYRIEYEEQQRVLSWQEEGDKKEKAKKLDGSYMLKTDRQDLSDDEIWRTYMLLTRVETAFRCMKSPLMERPIFHHLKHRVETHIFLCVLAYHLLVSIEKMFLDRGIHTSWKTLRQQLSTHQVVTVVLPASNGDLLKVRKGGTPEPIHKWIYETLRIPDQVMKTKKTWHRNSH